MIQIPDSKFPLKLKKKWLNKLYSSSNWFTTVTIFKAAFLLSIRQLNNTWYGTQYNEYMADLVKYVRVKCNRRGKGLPG
jgi:hypothetical protein